MGQVEQVPQPASLRSPVELTERDRPILLAAMAALATHLLTGDLKHFGPHMNRPAKSAGVMIQTVADYLATRKHRAGEAQGARLAGNQKKDVEP
jgi:hypothetical protein